MCVRVRRMRLRVRLRGGRTIGAVCDDIQSRMSSSPDRSGSGSHPALPEAEALTMQAQWLAPARAQLWRWVQIARRHSVLDLGTGYGAVVPELVRRSGGRVVALDRELRPLQYGESFVGAERIAADGACLPFADASFDLIFTQLTLLWVSTLDAVIAAMWRTLRSGGVVVSLEPDYGGMIEYPPEVQSRELWIRGLSRAGADPYVARKLPGKLASQGFEVHVSLFDTLVPPSVERFAFLEDLPLSPEEQPQLEIVKQRARMLTGAWAQVAHLPFFLIRALKV
jgi:ubiquinone/menaquinone biosynthesis C-methylase UbiE